MDNREKSFSVERTSELKEGELRPEVPIINIIRHGQTEYKELRDPKFVFNPDSPDFRLDTKHLDLTKEGIDNINATAEQLAGSIDKDNEAVILVTSPNYRAQSSLLLIEKVLLEKGITVLNSTPAAGEGKSKGIKKSQALEQIEFKDPGFRSAWIKEDKRYRQEKPEHLNKRPEEAHKEIAAKLGKEISDIFIRNHAQLDERFRRWLRHMTNISDYLNDETKELIGGRKIRLVSVTHEEVPDKFIQSFGVEENLKKAQMLEIQPQNPIKPKSATQAKVKLYQKGDSEGQEGSITIHYNPEEKKE